MINLIQILKDCPKGRKLYSPLYGEVELDHVTDRTIYAKYLDCGTDLAAFNEAGQVWGYETGECMLFPSSDKKSWNCWQPVLFEKGDIIHMNDRHDIAFLYDGYDVDGYYGINEGNFRTPLDIEDYRFATEDESQRFLKDMKEKGFKWNEETNQVEKIETPTNNPKFNVGDWIIDSEFEKARDIRKVVEIDFGTQHYVCQWPHDEKAKSSYGYIEKYFHLWTIEDARKGDILADDDSIFIYNGQTETPLVDNEKVVHIGYICALYNSKLNLPNEELEFPWWTYKPVHPASFGERIELLEAIASNGFKWNEETNQVEKIETPTSNPKFNVGDWIVNKGRSIRKIVGIDTSLNDYLTIKDYENITENLPIEHAEEYYHLWTIEDAKRGDTLVGECPGDKVILLYSGNLLEDTNSPDYTCALDAWGLQVFNEIILSKTILPPETIRPATVNERVDLLEAIKNNGYEVTLDNRVVKSSVVEEITHPEPIKLYDKENLAKELKTIFNNYGIDTRLNMRDYLIADHIIKYIDNLGELLKQQKQLEE